MGTDEGTSLSRSLSRATGNYSHHSRSSQNRLLRPRSRSPSSSAASQQSPSSLQHQVPSQTEPFPPLGCMLYVCLYMYMYVYMYTLLHVAISMQVYKYLYTRTSSSVV